ncbi:MAG: lysylphosphatidylglycerol synthase domain-containing protein [Bacteroidales bacterium]|nr:lysylphosphatidylglycerol synthase domain-containing protein [Bacteroidales bacterium]MDD4384415.1 lysylphosphatidylglycerol synthase domain-containing protein [Bacteroidales bacterium]MDY0196592.1 lysylphosphatidylglycerol synthase domain-containing protein [Tenuifilaceae bacterium]
MIKKKSGFLVVKILVAVLAYLYVAIRLSKEDFSQITSTFQQISPSSLWVIALVVLLMPINWLVEAIKWKFALRGIKSISIGVAIKTALYGAGIGLFTPNRIGDPFGRVALLKTERKAEAGILAVQCGLAQQLATIVFGLIGMGLLANQLVFAHYLKNPMAILGVALSLIIAGVFVFGNRYIVKDLAKTKVFKRMGLDATLFANIPFSSSLLVLLLSLLRYLVFSTQFVLVLILFGYSSGLEQAYSSVFVTYLFASLIPVLSIADAGVRSGFAVVFVGAFWNHPAAIVLAAHTVWLLNVALPSLLAVWLPFLKKR